MKGYLDKLNITQISSFKVFLVNYIYQTNILKEYSILKPINHTVFNIFFESALDKFKVSSN